MQACNKAGLCINNHQATVVVNLIVICTHTATVTVAVTALGSEAPMDNDAGVHEHRLVHWWSSRHGHYQFACQRHRHRDCDWQ